MTSYYTDEGNVKTQLFELLLIIQNAIRAG